MAPKRRAPLTSGKLRWAVDADEQMWRELEKPGNEANKAWYQAFLRDYYDMGGYSQPDYPKDVLKADTARNNAQRSDVMNNGCDLVPDARTSCELEENDLRVHSNFAYLDDPLYKVLLDAYRATLKPPRGTRYSKPERSRKREQLAKLLRLFTTQMEEYIPHGDD